MPGPEHAIKWCRQAQKNSTLGCHTLCVCTAAACTVAPHLAGALAANAAREGAEVKGAVNAANGHRRLERLPWWLTFVEIDIREQRAEGGAAQWGPIPQVFGGDGSCPTRGGAAGV